MKDRAQKGSRSDEIFWQQEYAWLASRLKPDTIILDLGACIGDTPIYFAQFREVKKVIAIEPAIQSYKKMLEYLKACPLKGKINPLNAAVGSKEGTIFLNESIPDSTGSSIKSMLKADGKPVKVMTLNSLLEGLRNVAIKCDIEGEEETLFDNANLSNVYALMVEWHNPQARDAVVKRLTDLGFMTETIMENEGIGMIKAWL